MDCAALCSADVPSPQLLVLLRSSLRNFGRAWPPLLEAPQPPSQHRPPVYFYPPGGIHPRHRYRLLSRHRRSPGSTHHHGRLLGSHALHASIQGKRSVFSRTIVCARQLNNPVQYDFSGMGPWLFGGLIALGKSTYATCFVRRRDDTDLIVRCLCLFDDRWMQL